MLESIRLADGAAAPAADSLRERVVLVTGATGGLGRATSLAVARAGATIVLLGRKVRRLEALYDEIEEAGAPTPALYPMDLEGATPKDHADLAATIERDFGRLDGLVHAAAQFDTLQPFEQQTAEEWSRTQHVNVTAPFLLTGACLPVLRRAHAAAIVFVFDDMARVGKAFWGGYGVAKHALLGLASMRTALRRAAYYGEDTLAHPDPAYVAAAIAWLLGDAGCAARGKVLDLRAVAANLAMS